jgi:hypothetical protein
VATFKSRLLEGLGSIPQLLIAIFLDPSSPEFQEAIITRMAPKTARILIALRLLNALSMGNLNLPR